MLKKSQFAKLSRYTVKHEVRPSALLVSRQHVVCFILRIGHALTILKNLHMNT